MIRSLARFSCLIITIATPISWAAPQYLPLTVDSSRSTLFWGVSFTLGSLVLPLQQSAPGSLSSPVAGWLHATYDPVTDMLSIGNVTGDVVQPDTRSFAPANSLGELSSIGGTISYFSLLSGQISLRDVSFEIPTFSMYAPLDVLPITNSYYTTSTFFGAGVDITFDYNVSGLVNASGSYPFSVSPGFDLLLVDYRRTGKQTFEVNVPIADGYTFFPVSIGGVSVGGSFSIVGNVTLQGTYIPEASTVTLLASIGIPLALGVFVRKGHRA